MSIETIQSMAGASGAGVRRVDIMARVGLFLLLILSSVPAYANPVSTAAQAMSDLNPMITPMFKAAKSFDTKLVPMASGFLVFAVMVELFKLVVDYYFRGGVQQLLSKAFTLFMVTAIPVFMLSNWDTVIFGYLWPFFHDDIAGAFMHGQSSSGIVANTIHHIVAAENQMAVVQGTSSSIIYQLIDVLTNILIQALLFIMNIPLIMALILSLYGPRMLFYVGGIFGPILVCWLPFKPLADFFSSWLKFMVTTGVAYAIGVVLALVTAAGLAHIGVQFQLISSQTGNHAYSDLAILGYMIPVVAMMLFMTLMLMKTESIATALVGGPKLGGSEGLGFAMGAAAVSALRAGGKGTNSTGGGEKAGGQPRKAVAGDLGMPTPSSLSSGAGSASGQQGNKQASSPKVALPGDLGLPEALDIASVATTVLSGGVHPAVVTGAISAVSGAVSPPSLASLMGGETPSAPSAGEQV